MGPGNAPESRSECVKSASLELQASLRGHGGVVWCVAWSLRGTLASSGADKSVRVWHSVPIVSEDTDLTSPPPEQWQCIADISGQTFLRTVRCVAWGVDGRSLATACFDATATVLELVGGKEPKLEAVVSLEGHESEVKSVAYSSSGGLLASSSRDRSVWIWEVGLEFEYECVAVLNGHSADVKCVRWHPASEILLSSSYDNDIRVWVEDEDDWFCLETLSAHDSTVWSMAFDATGKHFVSVGDGGTVVIWCRREPPSTMIGEHARYTVVTHLSDLHKGVVMSVDWAAKSNRIATGGDDDCIRILRRSDDSVGETCAEGNGDGPSESPPQEKDAGLVAKEACGDKAHSEADQDNANPAALRPETDQVWVEDVLVERAHSGCVNAVAWNPSDNGMLASCGDDGCVRIWNYSCPDKGVD